MYTNKRSQVRKEVSILEAQLLAVDSLSPHPRNNDFFDDITGGKWDEFLESVKASGIIEPLVITQNKVVVSGHQRLRACKELGIKNVYCIVRSYKSEDEILRDLIETNIQQRGTISSSKKKQALIIQTLERIYGIRNTAGRPKDDENVKKLSKNHVNLTRFSDKELTNPPPPRTKAQLAEALGLSLEQYATAKAVLPLIPDLQDMIDEGNLPATLARHLLARLTEQEQLELVKSLDTTKRYTAAMVQRKVTELQSADAGMEKKIEALERERDQYRTNIGLLEEKLRSLEAQDDKAGNEELKEKLKSAQADLIQQRENATQYLEQLKAAKSTAEQMKQAALDKQKEEYEKIISKLQASVPRSQVTFDELPEQDKEQLNDFCYGINQGRVAVHYLMDDKDAYIKILSLPPEKLKELEFDAAMLKDQAIKLLGLLAATPNSIFKK